MWWEGQRQAVSRILARWRTPAGPGFRIETEAGARFRLEYDAANDRWQVNKLDTDQ